MNSTPRDTTEEAREVQVAAYRAMTGAERVALAFELSDDMRTVTIEGIRRRHPNYDDEQVRHELLSILHGPELAAELMKSTPSDDH